MYLRGDPNDYFDGKTSIPEIHGINQNISCDKPNNIYIYVLHPPKNGDSDLSLFTYTDLGGCTNINI